MPRALPRTFVLELTRRCNNKCLYCYAVWGPCALEAGRDEMSPSEIRSILAQLRKDVPVETVALSGGEPLLRGDLPEILSIVRDQGIAPVIITNGTLLTKERVAATVSGSVYEVTLLSHRRMVHDRLAGRPGAWASAVDGMANVRRLSGRLVAAFVATRLNWKDLYKTAELSIALGAEGLMYNRINLGAFNMRHAAQLLPSPAMIRENLDALEGLGKTYKLPVAVSVVIEPCVLDGRKYEHIRFGWCPLGGEDSYFTIDPSGNVRICNHSPVILGNLKRDRFPDIYFHHPYVRRFRETWPLECVGCDPELKEMCRGGCKAAAEQCHGTFRRVDPFVTLNAKRRG